LSWISCAHIVARLAGNPEAQQLFALYNVEASFVDVQLE
jgi:hypothetical protein